MRDYKFGLPSFLFFRRANFDAYVIHARSARPSFEMLGVRVNVYTGKEFRRILIRPDMIGRSIGSFVATKITGVSMHKRKKRKG
jgi:ribosomal protein S19